MSVAVYVRYRRYTQRIHNRKVYKDINNDVQFLITLFFKEAHFILAHIYCELMSKRMD